VVEVVLSYSQEAHKLRKSAEVMSMGDLRAFDVAVIGGGPAGYVAAIRAAQAGMHTALIERSELGGTCLNRGCIPTKAMLHVAKSLVSLRHLNDIGVRIDGFALDYEQMLKWRDRVVENLRRGLMHLMRSNGVEVICGEASFTGVNELTVTHGEEESKLRFKKAIIATGSKPRSLRCLPEHDLCLLAEQALFMRQLPKRIAIIGAGAIGVEMAWLFKSLGSDVTLFELMPKVLPTMDGSISRSVEAHLRKFGIDVLTETNVTLGELTEDGSFKLRFQRGQEASVGLFDAVIVAIGRVPDTATINAEAVGVNLGSDGRVIVDNSLRTTAPHIYAIGDVIRGGGFAHQAMAEGELVVEAILGGNIDVESLLIPACVFIHPEVASVGLTEEELRQCTDSVLVGEFQMRANGRALACNEAEGFVKVVGDGRTGKLVGVHIFSAQAGEIINEATLAIQLGLKLDEFVKLIHPHPTLSEALCESAKIAIGKPLHMPKLVARLRRR